MVIVEYCKYGNLSLYLRSKRDTFVLNKVLTCIFVLVRSVSGHAHDRLLCSALLHHYRPPDTAPLCYRGSFGQCCCYFFPSLSRFLLKSWCFCLPQIAFPRWRFFTSDFTFSPTSPFFAPLRHEKRLHSSAFLSFSSSTSEVVRIVKSFAITRGRQVSESSVTFVFIHFYSWILNSDWF